MAMIIWTWFVNHSHIAGALWLHASLGIAVRVCMMRIKTLECSKLLNTLNLLILQVKLLRLRLCLWCGGHLRWHCFHPGHIKSGQARTPCSTAWASYGQLSSSRPVTYTKRPYCLPSCFRLSYTNKLQANITKHSNVASCDRSSPVTCRPTTTV